MNNEVKPACLAVEAALQRLRDLGASAHAHPAGDVVEHFRRTYQLLRDWGEEDCVCWAGLYHAVYGTESFDPVLLSLDLREEVAGVIGADAESHVYLFCACDRAYLARRLVCEECPSFRDRFTKQTFVTTPAQLQAFCTVTIANDIDVSAPDRAGYLQKYGRYVLPLFRSANFQRHLKPAALAACQRVFGVV
jgi:hypothetical protein